MKANELRIGNWLQRLDGSFFQVSLYDLQVINELIERWHPSPINITEEWLLKFGFTKNESKIVDSYSISISKLGTLKELSVTIQLGNEYVMIREGENDKPSSEDSIITLLNGDTHGRPFYVNQIQNLYFALTGEELIIKQKTNE
jgi:hypothetical protein